MVKNSVYPDELTYPLVLKSCIVLSDVGFARKIHGQVLKLGFESYDLVGSGLAEMHGKFCDGDSAHARLLFDKMSERDCVVWNLMIAAYSRSGCSIESLKLLVKMVRSGIRADMFTAIASLSSIGELKCLKRGKEMHAHVIRNGSDHQVSVPNSLIDMYCKCGGLVAARQIFDSVTNKTVVSWSSMIKGYACHEQFYDSFSIFMKMKLDGFKVDSITVINVLPACVNVGALEQVKYLHGYSLKGGLNLMQSVNTALLVSYAKCGCIEIARELFDEEEITSKDIITWNSMISAYSKHGNSIQCFELYNQIRHSKLKPDRHTFLGMLTACVNSGCVTEAWECFKEMTEKYGCQPNLEHYACMIDLLGRAGHVKEASELIKSMPFEPDARVLGPLLSACKLHPNTRLAEFAAQRLISMEPKNAGNYILLSNIYAAAGKWDRVAKMRTFLRDRGLKKNPGCSWLEINGKVHEFRVADRSHPLSDDIYAILADIEMETTDFKYRSSGNLL
ncbi:hypothetical protein RJ639_028641 [Escallonia herrerae]|uniref:Pentatricopeptide repeat-containing protein n=1 Tax=Escallonia herrerae TaxID=1293975 RepID=A0AA89BLJ4_9ASTE|nr:hypothetical protein RJ639_028641 [Escallonia herrerae]